MTKEFNPDPSFKPWGPFVGKDFRIEAITLADIVIASLVWGLTIINAIIALWLGYRQTKSSRSPLRSTYIWLIWMELLASFLMGIQCFLHLLKVIRPSFAFYFTILFWWCIQVQLLLQIIINRIRVIVPDRERSKWIMIGTAAIVTIINISVFNIWIPARLQVNHTYVLVNEIWDRIEKVLYLFIDAALNWYFLKTVKTNLINNGLQKYNKLLKFNQRIIVISLLMDVMIIAAMSIPNSFVYIQFHPLAYLVKLNIEMTMANLIKRIAISTMKRTGNVSVAKEFNSHSKSGSDPTGHSRSTNIELSSHNYRKGERASKTMSFPPSANQIKVTEEIIMQSHPNPDYAGKGGTIVGTRGIDSKARSLDDVTDMNSDKSVKDETQSDVQRQASESDDERLLGIRTTWKRLPG